MVCRNAQRVPNWVVYRLTRPLVSRKFHVKASIEGGIEIFMGHVQRDESHMLIWKTVFKQGTATINYRWNTTAVLKCSFWVYWTHASNK